MSTSAIIASAAATVVSPVITRLKRLLRNQASFLYITGAIFLTFCFVAVAATLAWEMGVHRTAVLVGLGALALFPLSELAIQIINALIISTFEPEPLPKLDFDKGIPPEDATLVVIPMMLSSLEVARQEVVKLEVRFLAGR